jgi:hypothetical protein
MRFERAYLTYQAYRRVDFFPLAPGPHPRRELTLMAYAQRATRVSPWPRALYGVGPALGS